jgi:hypothetical protein
MKRYTFVLEGEQAWAVEASRVECGVLDFVVYDERDNPVGVVPRNRVWWIGVEPEE